MNDAPSRREYAVLFLGLAVLGALYAPSLVAHATHALSSSRINDDARQQIWPFLEYHGVSAFATDYLARYQRAMNPWGWDLLYAVTARWIDPRTLSAALPYGLLAVFISASMYLAWRLAGVAAALGTCLLILSSDLYLHEMSGALPRGFAFPVVALAACALVAGSTRALAALTCLSATLYYPLAVLVGCSLALSVLFRTGFARPDRRGLAWVAGTAAVSVLLMTPSMMAMREFGTSIGPSEWVTYPEAAPGGRLSERNIVTRQSVPEVVSAVRSWTMQGVSTWETPWNNALREAAGRYSWWIGASLLTATIIGLLRVAPERSHLLRRLSTLLAASFLSFTLAWAALPLLYVPERYIKFVIPCLVVVTLPVGLYWLTRSARSQSSAAAGSAVSLAGCVLIVLVFGGRGPTRSGLDIRFEPYEAGVYQFIATLPPGSLIAGWPDTVDSLPYKAGRRVLLTRELHLPFHTRYVDEMRRRMTMLTAAYFATDPAPLVRLRDEYQVTHLVVDRRHFTDQPPTYFQPFTADVARQSAQSSGRAIVMSGTIEPVFEAGSFLVIDLRSVQPESSGRSALVKPAI